MTPPLSEHDRRELREKWDRYQRAFDRALRPGATGNEGQAEYLDFLRVYDSLAPNVMATLFPVEAAAQSLPEGSTR